MIPALGAEQVLQTLGGFKEYATMGTLLVLDLVGTFVFALSGATAGVNHRLDLFGVLVVSFVTATAGGIMRDVLIGAVPPAAPRDWPYVGISLLSRSEEHTSELQSHSDLVCRLLLEKKK